MIKCVLITGLTGENTCRQCQLLLLHIALG